MRRQETHLRIERHAIASILDPMLTTVASMPQPETGFKVKRDGVGEPDAITLRKNIMKIAGQVALISGASRGLGRAIAIALAREGADIAVNYFPDTEGVLRAGACETAKLCQEAGVRAVALPGDVSDFGDCQLLGQRVEEEFGRIDILVNNAGILRDRTLRKMTREEWDAVINVNLSSCFNTCKAVIEPMVAQGYGRIVNVSSVIAHIGGFGQTNYAAAKAGMLGFTKSLAREVAKHGITVNAVAPGLVDTEMTRTIPEEQRARILESIPMGYGQQPEEIASAVVWLASPAQRSVTGCCLNVNGGWYMA